MWSVNATMLEPDVGQLGCQSSALRALQKLEFSTGRYELGRSADSGSDIDGMNGMLMIMIMITTNLLPLYMEPEPL